ncbi:MAG: hypothetical protein AB7O98_17075 [Hyphomonadaceae bacterium]
MQRRTFVTSGLAFAAAPVSAWAQAAPGVSVGPERPPEITPQNELERVFLEAFHDEERRPFFRRALLISEVALAISSRDPMSPPRQIELRPGLRACVLFTSSARATEVMGAAAPRLIVPGRQALERVRGANVVININLTPTLVLEAPDVADYLDLPVTLPQQSPGAPAPQRRGSAGPTE